MKGLLFAIALDSGNPRLYVGNDALNEGSSQRLVNKT